MENEKYVNFKSIEKKVDFSPEVVEKEISGKNYVLYGEDNKYPQYLFDLYLKSSVLQSIINGTTNYVMGNDIILGGMYEGLAKKCNNNFETIEDVIKKAVLDYLIFGGFALEIIRDIDKKISEIYWLDFNKVRIDKECKKVFYSNSWGKWGAKAISYPIFDRNKEQSHSILYFKGHKTRGVYPIPLYSGALNAIETSVEISKFHLKSIKNNFNASAIVSFNNGQVSEDVANEIEEQINAKFSGSDNASRLLLVFNDSKDNAVTISRLSEDNLDKKYEQLRRDIMQEIFVAFSATPSLFGSPIEGIGFNNQEYDAAYGLYNRSMIIPIQNDIVRIFDVLLGEGSITFVPFSNKLEENK